VRADLVVHMSLLLVQDMRKNGHTLAEILAAGQWKSTKFIKYEREAGLEKEVAYQVATHSDE
jgi:hypothetical protein